ncbi:hypothetical protein CA850_24660 [Micromonospora echinospora]|uniref:Uncharacterized protein n=1 Tax=Micromonospora echinospora TaxID=1877 RepID=A0A1C4YXV2_MICEC|nr:hypothetical protein [Micromonospora echinospora]OZV77193.1 hypothetical protein CA850_24660 [Micromonospora echinospora]SCF25602.1 hypothetical protein GA0070618_4532 [Micromonospora echinospora]
MSDKGLSRRSLLGGAVAGGVASVAATNPAAAKPLAAEPMAAGQSAAAPSHLLRASAITTTSDPWLPDGTHLRVNVSPRIGLPLHPLTAFRIDVVPIYTRPDKLETSTQHVWLNPDLSVAATGGGIRHTGSGDVHYLVLHGWQWTFRAVRCCFVRLLTQSGSAFRVDVLDPTAELPDAEPRVLATRTAPSYEFGGTDITLLRVSGAGVVDLVEIVSTESPYIVIDPAQAVSFGLPIGSGPWYAPEPATDPVAAARTRVEQGAARRMGPPDRPDGAVVPLTPADEVNRVQALSGASSGLDYWLARAFTDPATPPLDARVSLAGGPVADASGTISPLNALLAAAVDPAVARHLGLAARVNPPTGTSVCTLWMVAGLWLLPLDRPHDAGTLRSLITGFPPPAHVVSALYSRYPGLSALATQRVTQLRAAHPTDGWTAVPLMVPAVAAKATPDRPAAPRTLALPAATWRVTTGERLWTQRIPLLGPAAGGMLGLARLSPTPVSLHGTIRVGSVDRARAMVAHWDRHHDDAGSVTDLAVTGPSNSWGLWRADEFGRWSDRSTVAAPAPAVAGPPTPIVEAEFRPAIPDGGLQPRSPGALRIRIGVPGPSLPGALPSRDVTSPGGAPVTSALLTVDGVPQPAIPVPAGVTSVVATVAVREFGVGDTAAIPVIAKLVDAAGRPSAPAEVERTVHDPRAYAPLRVAPTLLFAAERNPMGDSELGLEWSGGAWGYRVYLGDERRLGGTGAGPRCERAAEVWARSGHLADRRRFTLVTPKPLRAAPDGVVRFTHRLPGSLRNVQFVRVVPVTSAGVETPFETCGLTPVAVPVPDRPPAPVVQVRPRGDGRVDVTITATGLRDDLLAGLTEPPQARLRRGRLADSDPEYMPVVQTGIPLVKGPDGTWSATVVDGPAAGFPGYVRLTWLAEVRYPAEPHLPADALPAGSDVQPIGGVPAGPQVSGWGPASPPTNTVLTPEVQLVPRATVRPGQGYNEILVTNAPVSHRYAIAPHQVVVHRFFASGPYPSAALPPVPITATTTVVRDTTVNPRPTGYMVVITDPFGRSAPPVYVQY